MQRNLTMKTKQIFKYIFLCLIASFTQSANAHVMVAQHGTLNVVDNGVFMVLSIPINAFEGVDDDKDGRLSKVEFDAHHSDIALVVKDKITLSDKNGKLELKGLILSPVTSHHSPKEPASQLVVMGKFILNDINSPLHYQVNVFGKQLFEKLFEITVKNKEKGLKQAFTLTPEVTLIELFTE